MAMKPTVLRRANQRLIMNNGGRGRWGNFVLGYMQLDASYTITNRR